jgi:RNA polymerase sigma factor (sigma-70 family)
VESKRKSDLAKLEKFQSLPKVFGKMNKEHKGKLLSDEFNRRYIVVPYVAADDLKEPNDFFRLRSSEYRAFLSANLDDTRKRNREFLRWHKIYSETREILAEKHLGLIYTMISRLGIIRDSQDDDEAISEGFLGLSHSLDGYNPFNGFRFSTYACTSIIRGVIRYFHNKNRFSTIVHSFDEKYDENHEDNLINDNTEMVVDSVLTVLEDNSAGLTDQQLEVIRARYLNGNTGELPSFREIGKLCGFSRQRAQQAKEAGFDKIREHYSDLLKIEKGLVRLIG